MGNLEVQIYRLGMKIAFLSRYQNTVERGAENFVLELSKRLSRNHAVDVFAGKDADDISKVITGRYDLVIPINGRLQSLKASLGRIPGRYKLLISGHSGIGRDDIWNIMVCKPNVFVALTDQMASWAKKWAFGGKVVKIPNGIDLETFSPQGEKTNFDLPKPIVLSVGALVWYKHHEKLIEAASLLKDCSVLVVGKGTLKDELEQLGKKKLGKRFMISDFKYEDMPKVYRGCSLFSLPSWDREAFGLVYLEAMACGLGVVVPDDKRKEIVGVGGLFANVDDPVNYAETIKGALSLDLSQKARKQAEEFSWEKIAAKYEKLMISTVSNSN